MQSKRVHLQGFVKGRNDYINSVAVSVSESVDQHALNELGVLARFNFSCIMCMADVNKPPVISHVTGLDGSAARRRWLTQTLELELHKLSY